MCNDPYKTHRDPEKVYVDYYVNGKLEFAFWQDESLTTKQEVIDRLIKGKEWKFMAWYCGWKIKSTKVSKDLLRVDITVSEKKS